MALITITTVIGNMAVVIALRRLRRAPAHYPLASLATADLLVGVFVLPMAAARELFVFHLNWAICSCWSTLDVLCCTASILSLCALGWERFSCITAPLARARRCQQAKLYAVLVWPISTVVALPTAFIPSERHYYPGELEKACTVNTNVGYVFFSISFSFYLPASVMITFYARIVHLLTVPPTIRSHRGRPQNQDEPKTAKVRNQAQMPGDENGTQGNEIMCTPKRCHLNLPTISASNPVCTPKSTLNSPGGLVPRQNRATRTIIMLMSLFLLCWTPFFIMLPLDSLCDCVWDVVWYWCTWISYANSAINPIVYAAASPSVRRVLFTFNNSSTRSTIVPLSPSVRRS